MRKHSFCLFVWFFCYTGGVVEHWNMLPGEVAECSSLEIFKTLVDTAVDNLL